MTVNYNMILNSKIVFHFIVFTYNITRTVTYKMDITFGFKILSKL